MVEYGQYPLILQKDNRNGILVPVGLAEASSLTFQSLSATTISATSYANLPTFGGNFTGIQTVCAVGVCGAPILHSVVAGNTLNLKNIYFNLGNFVSVTTPGTDVTISYDQPLAAIRGGTGAHGGNSGEIPYWDPGNALTSDPNLSYDGAFLLAPKFDSPGGYYVNAQPFDLGNLNSVDLTTPPTNDQVLSYDTGTGKWVAQDQTGGVSIPADACCVIFNDTLGNPDTDPGDFTYNGNTIRFPTGIATNSMTAQSFVENGTALSVKYQIADATLCALGDLTLGANQILYFDGSQNPAISPITANARGLLDDVNYSDMRTTLGLGTIATKSVIVLDSADVCNTLPVTKGGTGITSFPTQDGIVYAAGGSLTQISQPTGSDKSLKWTGAAFTWATIPTGTFVSPTDPCAIVFVNNAGDNIVSDPDLTYDTVGNTLNAGNLNSAGFVLAGGNIATVGGYVAGAQIYGTTIYEGGVPSPLSNLYQGKDPTLTTLANMNTGADVLLYFSATDAAASTTITNPARQLLDDLSFTAMRTTLGLGTLATKSAVALNSADVCNTLPVTNGGTGKTTLTPCAVLFGNGTGTVSEVTAPTTNNTYLRWNSGFSWAAAGEQWTHVFKTANQKINSTSYTNDNTLAATTVNGSNYIIKYSIYFSANTTNGISTQVDISPGYQTFTYRINYTPPGVTVDSMVRAGAVDAFDYQGAVASTGAGHLELDCVIVDVKDTSVPIQFKLTSSGGSDELFILKGSHLKYTTF
jgi:hypothetical protein